MGDDFFTILFKIAMWLLFWWVLIPYYLLKWIIKSIVTSGNEAKANRLAERARAESRDELQDARRRKQLEDLAASLPATPPQKMRAAFAVNEVPTRLPHQKMVEHMFGEPSYITEWSEKVTLYAADMVLQLSETERAIIRQHRIDDVVLEDEPMYSQSELVLQRVEARERANSIKDPLLREVTKQVDENVNELVKSERRKTRVGDLLVSPYSRMFDTYHEAHDHLDRLKLIYVPKIRELIDRYGRYKPKETIEF